MAKLERTLSGDFNQIIKKIENGILNVRQYCSR